MLEAWVNNINFTEIIPPLLDADLKIIDKTKYSKDMINQVIVDLGSSNNVKYEARMHNRQVHSLNGNIFLKAMEDGMKSTGTRKIMEEVFFDT